MFVGVFRPFSDRNSRVSGLLLTFVFSNDAFYYKNACISDGLWLKIAISTENPEVFFVRLLCKVCDILTKTLSDFRCCPFQ